MDPFVVRFAERVRSSALLAPGTDVVVACSGGADSVALLRLLVAARRLLRLGTVSVAHLDHALRTDSPEDARFVAGLARELGVAVTIRRRAVRRRRGESLEDAARRARYAFLGEAARACPGSVLVTAHHADDQAETVLYRALRGAGIEGLRGVLPEIVLPRSHVRVVRPLLSFRRAELRSWLERCGATWREDPTNAAGNDRARLRNVVLPAIRRELGRDPVPPLARLAEIARATATPPRPAAPRADSVARRSRERPESSDARVTWEERELDTSVFLERLRARGGTMELLAADGVRPPFAVRSPRAGDRFHALGMQRPQRLTHHLQRRGVPAAGRRSVLLLCDADGIVWVVGHGIAARAALKATTRRTWVVRRVAKDSGTNAARRATSRSRPR